MALKVILRQDVPNLGQNGEIKQVTPGYFRNFLQPRGLAVEATKGHLKQLEQKSTVRAGLTNKAQERSAAIAGEIAAITVRIPVKLGEQGRLYGSVTNKDIAEALAEQGGFTIDRHKIELRDPLKTIGVHSVPIKLEHGVDAFANVELVPEGDATS
ncbi:MAG: 50S ribosomal protein L9 [Chloroflexota bacterium]